MIDKTYLIEILTPEKKIFKGEITSLIVPGWDGYLGVLKNHAPLLSLLDVGTIEIKATYLIKKFKITHGYLKVLKNNAAIIGEKIEEVVEG